MYATDLLNPWVWCPSKSAWYKQAGVLLENWKPTEKLALDSDLLFSCLAGAITCEADWMLHPCMNALTLTEETQRLQRDFQLAVWVAAQSKAFLGEIYVPETLCVWSLDGGFMLSPGKYDLAVLGTMVVEATCPSALAIDLWCYSIGFPLPETWAALQDLADQQQKQLQEEVLLFLSTLVLAKSLFKNCLDWITSVARVVVPLYNESNGGFRSGSQNDLPGLIYLDFFGGEFQIMEALVHESAHLHLFLAEMEGTLVNPDHRERYASPLRPEPRPLRGILLAYHAIAYICAFYVEAIQQGRGISYCQNELQTMRVKLNESEQILLSCQQFLTEHGRAFFQLTQKVANYGRQ
jgi:hypothetical protein